jgi:hypothetical protein
VWALVPDVHAVTQPIGHTILRTLCKPPDPPSEATTAAAAAAAHDSSPRLSTVHVPWMVGNHLSNVRDSGECLAMLMARWLLSAWSTW